MADIKTALDKSMAVIEFKPDGTVLDANENFLKTMGYSLDEVKGKHHSMFADAAYAASQEYKDFWKKLAAGEFEAAQYKRYGKGGKEIWIEASYNPIMSKTGKVYKVVKFATDITKQILKSAERESIVNAINRSQAVIEFTLDGTILDANDNFLSVMGYSLDEVKGKHHSMFADAAYAASQEYKDFWKKLAAGEFQAAQYKRYGKGGKEIWIEASYNPIFDAEGKPFKVVKFATDLTPRKEESLALANDFEANVKTLVADVVSSIQQVQNTSNSLAASADDTSSRSNVVAATTEELSASIHEISTQVTNAVKVVGTAVEQTKISENLVSGLVEAAEKIGEVTALISEIADQTNLLALNATIEAARAGDAGKGFAVVASEVKKLALETASATGEIGSHINNIQGASETTAQAIRKVTNMIEQVNEISTAISSAVEEQSAATKDVATNITSVQAGANQTGESSAILSDVAQGLSKRSETLNKSVDDFLLQVRSS
ncbi:MAG: chemotaxis protein [Micavibrio sp.]|nr:chemotaxis protein [Micavibrio sp.]